MGKYAGGVLLPTLRAERNSERPISLQLVSAMRELILSGVLKPGQRLPSSRTLANEQKVSRTTAVSVYDSLVAEGLIVSRVGAGSFISDALTIRAMAPDPRPADEHRLKRQSTRVARLTSEASERHFPRLAHPAQPRPFVTGLPAYDHFPMARWAKLSAQQWRAGRNPAMGYPQPGGLMALRQAIADHLRANRGIICDPEEVFIVNGAQEAFNVVGSTLLDPGDTVWFENPGAIGARNSLVSCGARLVPVPIDSEGLDVEAGISAAPDFRLAFVTPSHQHPLGVVMSLERRFQLLQAAERADAWIVEDDYDGEFYYSGHPPPTLKSVDRTGRVIYVGTFSKSLFPALRIAFMVVTKPLLEVFDRIAGATHQGVPTHAQAVTARFIEEGHFASHIRRMRRLYAERQTALIEESGRLLAGAIEVEATESGFQTVGYLRVDLDETALAVAAEQRGVIIAPLSRFAIGPIAVRGYALGFSTSSPREIREGLRALAAAIDETL